MTYFDDSLYLLDHARTALGSIASVCDRLGVSVATVGTHIEPASTGGRRAKIRVQVRTVEALDLLGDALGLGPVETHEVGPADGRYLMAGRDGADPGGFVDVGLFTRASAGVTA